MSFKVRFISFALIVLCILALHGRSYAQPNYLPAPYVPWLASQGYSQQNDTVKEKNARRYTGSASWKKIPDDAVLTPEQTMALIDRLNKQDEDIALPSPLEQAYSARIVDTLTQFGYDMFASDDKIKGRDKDRTGIPAGAVQDDFVLNIGDAIKVTFRGQRHGSKTYSVDNQGLLVVDDLDPVTAAGRSMKDVRESLEAQAQLLPNTDIYIALDKVRQIDVLVVGDVKKPGRKTLTVFDTVLDAINESGGIEKTGTLREIKLVRHGRSTVIDLYGLLVHGSANMDLGLQDGDKLIVPPIGPTVAIAGGVKRPGIYEILPALKGMLTEADKRSSKISLENMLEMAGGVLSPGQNRFMKLGLITDGKETVEDINKPFDNVFGDGAILMVASSREDRTGTVELVGDTRRPGIFDLGSVPTLSKLLDDESVFGPDIYPLIGVIERWDDDQMATKMLAFPPLLVIKGQFDRKLRDGDTVHLFSRDQILALQDKDSDKDEKPEDIEPAAGSVADLGDDITDPVLISFLTEHSTFIRGAVRQQGAYPVADGATLKNLVAAAGGLTLEANTQNIEVTSALQGEDKQAHSHNKTRRTAVNYDDTDPDSVMLEPGDTVRVNQKFQKIADNSVVINGEVKNPGRYDLLPGDTLSDLLRRAGGLTDQAYPDGTIFSREAERKAEESRFRAAARDMERALAAAMDDKDKAPDAGQIAMARDLAAELRQVQAVGRITVEANPGVLKAEPDLDILLQSGDRIYVPQRPLTVRVNGEILSPATLQFRKDKDASDYIAEAGGYTYNADKDRIFVLYPDGSAQPLQVSVWNNNPAMIPPGSTIVVPRDPKPFSFIESARDISQILSNLAITGIFLDDLRKKK